jgi:hypothetical protein
MLHYLLYITKQTQSKREAKQTQSKAKQTQSKRHGRDHRPADENGQV